MHLKLAATVGVIFILAALSFIQLSNATLENQVAQNESLFTIRAEPEKASYTAGEKVMARVYLTNVGIETKEVYFTGDSVRIFNQRGEPIYAVYSQMTSAYAYALTPQNETLLYNVVWNQNYRTAQGDLVKAPSGTYIVKISVRLVDVTNREATVESNPEAVTFIRITGDPNLQPFIAVLTVAVIVAVVTLIDARYFQERENLKAGKPQV
jgi:hypothetical protein